MVEGWGQGGTPTERMAGEEEKRRDFVQWRGWEGRREEGGQGRRDLVQLRREEVTGREGETWYSRERRGPAYSAC